MGKCRLIKKYNRRCRYLKRKKLKMFVCCTVVLTIVVGVCGGYVDASKKNDMPSEKDYIVIASESTSNIDKALTNGIEEVKMPSETDSILNENDARVVKLNKTEVANLRQENVLVEEDINISATSSKLLSSKSIDNDFSVLGIRQEKMRI